MEVAATIHSEGTMAEMTSVEPKETMNYEVAKVEICCEAEVAMIGFSAKRVMIRSKAMMTTID
jgi:hypothetical protein